MASSETPSAVEPFEAYQRLVDGNRRFLSGVREARSFGPMPANVAQRPFAIVLGCSDSRTPVEIVFDQGFGDLFVVRVAGNIASPAVVGSVEFAASQFGSSLVVVLGHSRCGAVEATIDAIASGQGPESKNIRSITDRIAPHVEGLVRVIPPGPDARPALVEEAVRANVRAAASHLRHGSRILEDLVLGGRLVVLTAKYELDSGRVEFFGDLPARR